MNFNTLNVSGTFPAIESFTKKCCEYAEEFGYTETLCGRRRYFSNISHKSQGLRSYAQRQAVNFCVQGKKGKYKTIKYQCIVMEFFPSIVDPFSKDIIEESQPSCDSNIVNTFLMIDKIPI